MSHKQLPMVATWRVAVRDSSLSWKAKLVAHTIATYMNADGGNAFPSVETIAAGASLAKRTVERALAELEAAGFVEIRHSRGRSSNRYQALLPDEFSHLLTASVGRGSEGNSVSRAPNSVTQSPNSVTQTHEEVELDEQGLFSISEEQRKANLEQLKRLVEPTLRRAS